MFTACKKEKEKDYTTENIVRNPEYTYDYPPEMIDGKICIRYVLSEKNLTSDDLSTGVLPSKINEIVLYSSDDSVIGQTLKMYFCNYYDFAEDHMKIFKAEEGIGIQEIDGKVGLEGEYKIVDSTYYKLSWDDDCIPISRDDLQNDALIYVDERLGNQEAGLSKYWIKNQTHMAEKYGTQTGLYNFIAISFKQQWRKEPEGLKVPESEDLWEDSLSLTGYSCYIKDVITNTGVITDFGEIIQKISDTPTESGDYTLAVSQELFDRIYNYNGTKIIAVYAEPGQETQVKEALWEQGYREYSIPESLWGKWNKGE